jgi:hypothetical protein
MPKKTNHSDLSTYSAYDYVNPVRCVFLIYWNKISMLPQPAGYSPLEKSLVRGQPRCIERHG